jgi:hypothetical protein
MSVASGSGQTGAGAWKKQEMQGIHYPLKMTLLIQKYTLTFPRRQRELNTLFWVPPLSSSLSFPPPLPSESSWQNPKEWPVQFMRVDWVGHAFATRSRELSVSTQEVSYGEWEKKTKPSVVVNGTVMVIMWTFQGSKRRKRKFRLF